jgi:multidrug efflux pump subunit AcrA (membrane-fusion protein)
MDLEASQQQQALDAQQLQAQVSTKQRELETTSAQLMHWQGRAQVAEARAQQQAQQLGCSTPRPKRDLGLLCDLVDPLQQQLIEQALVGGEFACSLAGRAPCSAPAEAQLRRDLAKPAVNDNMQ